MLPLVTDAQARDAVSAQDAIRIVEQTYGDLGSSRASLSDPELMRLDHDARGFALKGAVLDRYGAAGLRVIPSHLGGGNGWCLLLETASGRPLARVEETWLHRLRTAASAVVAARLLARADSRVLTLVGTGRIADLVPAACAAGFAVEEIRVVGRRAGVATDFAARHSAGGVKMAAYDSLDEAAAGADVIVAVTSATQPVIHARHLEPGCAVIGLGGGAEIAGGVLLRSDRFYVDELGFARTVGSVAGWLEDGLALGELRARLTGSLSAVVNGEVPGRTSPDERILAVVQGVAACDVALACLVIQRLGLG
ncbi:hypothetical protein AB0M46_38810 [Dactylosporangium sp. NPDC051485]|uniref:ornithine cyclodeaminase family protein n=1 Tax=Dactylosporangium sp. NPDC051485 TaxID=3154846 RepID=UPI0034464BDD